MSIALQFHGAARQTTGSKHLLLVNGKQILLDCGLVQGPRRLATEANRRLPVDGRALTAVVLSHAHIDHSGALPSLVKAGYHGPIHCTEATKDLVAVMLRDSGHIQEQDALYLRKKGIDVQPIYDQHDVESTVRLLRSVPYHRAVQVCPEVVVTFLDAGHILGSASVVLDVDDGRTRARIVFTGDVGRKNMPILRDPEPLPECDVLITESTYGDRLHDTMGDLEEELAKLVNQEQEDGGRILVPAFAVGRTQALLLYLGRLMHAGRIPRLPVWVDSPLAAETTRIMARHYALYDEQIQSMLRDGQNPFFFEGVRFVADVQESKSLNAVRSGVIISASGMCESGRILHHLAQSVGRREDCVLIVGFQAEGTLGRKLLEGRLQVSIFGEPFQVRCRVRQMQGMSAHADFKELLAHVRHLAGKARVFVVHGEESAALAFAGRLGEAGFRRVDVPRPGEKFEIAP